MSLVATRRVRLRGRILATPLAVFAAIVSISGCGGSSSKSTSQQNAPPSNPVSPTPGTTQTALDPCVVGSWKSTDASGQIPTSGGQKVIVSGGQGHVLTIGKDGRFTENFTNTQPLLSGVGDVEVDFSGTGTGRASTAGGRLS